MEDFAIHTDQLFKSYEKGIFALKDLSIDVPQGEIFGFLGPNGAGKTTTVKLLTGLLKPTRGTCSVMGLPPFARPADTHRICGVVTESARMYGRMTGLENLEFFAETQGLDEKSARARAEELLKAMGLWDARDKTLRTYSTGMAQRLSLARALVGKPRVLFLDEPTSGLDPETAQEVNRLIASLSKNEGVTVFLCTHQLRYAQDICSRYGILERGDLLTCGTLESMSRSAQIFTKAEIRVRDGDRLDGMVQTQDGWWQADLHHDDEMPGLLKKLMEGGHEIYEARLVKPTLEDVYFRYVKMADEEGLTCS